MFLFVSFMLVFFVVSFEMLFESIWEGNFGILFMGVFLFVINLENIIIVEFVLFLFVENYLIFVELYVVLFIVQDLVILVLVVESGNYFVILLSVEVLIDLNSFSIVLIVL